MPLKLALGGRETVAGQWLGALEGGGYLGVMLRLANCVPSPNGLQPVHTRKKFNRFSSRRYPPLQLLNPLRQPPTPRPQRQPRWWACS